jgi:hypothetical protein
MSEVREKKWIDCPICGAKNSMKPGKHLRARRVPRGYSPLDIDGLEGQFCEVCRDGFWSLESERKITRLLAEHLGAEPHCLE